MVTKLKLIFALFLIVFFISCDNSDKEDKSAKIEKSYKDFALKNNAVLDWDTTLYSYQFQEMFIDQNRLMLFKGRIYDIMKQDSNYVVKVLDERMNETKNFIALITFTPQQFEAIHKGNRSTNGAFILKISKVTSSNPLLKTDQGSDEDGNTDAYTHLSDDNDQMITIFRAKLIDFRLEETEN